VSSAVSTSRETENSEYMSKATTQMLATETETDLSGDNKFGLPISEFLKLNLLITRIMDSVMFSARMIRNFFIGITPLVIIIVLWSSYGDLTRKRFKKFKEGIFNQKKDEDQNWWDH